MGRLSVTRPPGLLCLIRQMINLCGQLPGFRLPGGWGDSSPRWGDSSPLAPGGHLWAGMGNPQVHCHTDSPCSRVSEAAITLFLKRVLIGPQAIHLFIHPFIHGTNMCQAWMAAIVPCRSPTLSLAHS